MNISSPSVILAIICAVLSILFLIITISVVKKRKIFASALNFVIMLLMLSLSALFATITVAIQGYHALTREDVAATVSIQPTGEQKFIAHFVLPDGNQKTFSISGDQLYVDAHILKWKPIVNIFGMHTSYELDRVSGRYANLEEEKTKSRTVYSISTEKPVDMFNLRQRFAALNPLLDAEYGSATFINTNSPEEFKIMVSTSGLLVRKVEKPVAQ